MTENAPNIVILLTNGSTKCIKFLKNIVNPTVIAAILAVQGIRKQLRNKNITEERQKWLTSLKKDVTKYIYLLKKIMLESNNDSNSKDILLYKDTLYRLHYRIIFDLNKKDEKIDSKIIELLEIIELSQYNINPKSIKYLENWFSIMFKFEWERIGIETGFGLKCCKEKNIEEKRREILKNYEEDIKPDNFKYYIVKIKEIDS